MIWNNGDGTDDNNGDAGVDEALITAGTANDVIDGQASRRDHPLRPAPNAPFGINMKDDEKLSITSFSGNDSLDPPSAGVTLPMNIDGGDDDLHRRGRRPDRRGDCNEHADQRRRRRPHRRRPRQRHGSTAASGDDMLVWNNGDGSDVMNGDAGTDRIEDNLGAGDDVSTLKNENGRVRYDRTSAGAFNLASVATAEIFRAQHPRRQ